MDWQQRRLLELAGLRRRRTPDSILLTEDEDEGGDDLFGDDDAAGDDEGGDDPFGGADDAGDDGAEEGGDNADDVEGSNREPPEELTPQDIERFGSPRFLDVENKLKQMFNDSWTSASVGAQEVEVYPGNAIDEEPPTPAKDDSPAEEEEPAADEAEDDDVAEENEEEKETKEESFYRYGNKRDKWLINEATRLLSEAEVEGAAADEFDMERFATELANYMDNIHNTEDIEGGIFNSARQMVLNNFGSSTEQEFIDMLASVTNGQWDFLGGHQDVNEVPLAVGASSDAAGA